MYNTYQVQYHEDDRAQRLLNIFPHLDGQVNISYVQSTEHVSGWHVHRLQKDVFFAIKGSFKVGLAFKEDIEAPTPYEIRWHYLSDKTQEGLIIPPGVWHGYKALEPNSIMLYGLTHKYDPSDETKVLPGHFGEDWGTKSK